MAQEKINPWVIALRILFTLALIWAVVFIFSNSMEVAQVSTAHSDEVLACAPGCSSPCVCCCFCVCAAFFCAAAAEHPPAL